MQQFNVVATSAELESEPGKLPSSVVPSINSLVYEMITKFSAGQLILKARDLVVIDL